MFKGKSVKVVVATVFVIGSMVVTSTVGWSSAKASNQHVPVYGLGMDQVAKAAPKVVNSKNDYANHWAANEIKWALEQKLMGTYPNGAFRPDETITQSQYLSALVTLHKLKDKTPHPATAKSWAKEAYEKAAKADWFTPDIKISPDVGITRYEAAAWITNAWGHKTYDPMQFGFRNQLLYASHKFNKGLFDPTGKKVEKSYNYYFKTVKNDDKFTRAEAAHTFYLLNNKYKNIEEAKGWVKSFQDSLVIKGDMLYGKVPEMPNIQFVKQSGFLYKDVDTIKLESGKQFSVPLKGQIMFISSHYTRKTLHLMWYLPNTKPVDEEYFMIEKEGPLHNRNKQK
ncbi:S-layer homology domain-containing protein [Brevibacillus daliensis]|uniref:S-layer homology domain-containing protein n=1 Tax=Brevibacillus daliensis TaxID=2892995 RepID=UPI001E58A4CB|nr:S-layer homology domain-containing protein [Brevibacillus daliensis]